MEMNLNNQPFTSCHVASLKVLALSLPPSLSLYLASRVEKEQQLIKLFLIECQETSFLANIEEEFVASTALNTKHMLCLHAGTIRAASEGAHYDRCVDNVPHR
jgi:hypothetical protein